VNGRELQIHREMKAIFRNLQNFEQWKKKTRRGTFKKGRNNLGGLEMAPRFSKK
jgi:hypothetical protein